MGINITKHFYIYFKQKKEIVMEPNRLSIKKNVSLGKQRKKTKVIDTKEVRKLAQTGKKTNKTIEERITLIEKSLLIVTDKLQLCLKGLEKIDKIEQGLLKQTYNLFVKASQSNPKSLHLYGDNERDLASVFGLPNSIHINASQK
jgi:hypothetical protein